MTSLLLSQSVFTLKRPRVTNFADIIKIQPCLLKQPFKTQRKLKYLKIMH